MRARRIPTRLEVHRLKFHQNGRRGPLLTWTELSDLERELIHSELLQDIRVTRSVFDMEMSEQDFVQAKLRVLSEWGVMCPHPRLEHAERPDTLRCEACGCLLVPRALGVVYYRSAQ